MRLFAALVSVAMLQLNPPAWSQTAVVQLRDEPRHIAKLENEFVRVVDLVLRPGDTTLYYGHTTDKRPTSFSACYRVVFVVGAKSLRKGADGILG